LHRERILTDIDPKDREGAFVGQQETGKEAHEGCFSGGIGADEARDDPSAAAGADLVESADGPLGGSKAFRHPVEH
jgi:hypothetical protein